MILNIDLQSCLEQFAISPTVNENSLYQHPQQHFLSVVFLLLAITTFVIWNFKVVLICISLIVRNFEHIWPINLKAKNRFTLWYRYLTSQHMPRGLRLLIHMLCPSWDPQKDHRNPVKSRVQKQGLFNTKSTYLGVQSHHPWHSRVGRALIPHVGST